jgi:hypothetical protein
MMDFMNFSLCPAVQIEGLDSPDEGCAQKRAFEIARRMEASGARATRVSYYREGVFEMKKRVRLRKPASFCTTSRPRARVFPFGQNLAQVC